MVRKQFLAYDTVKLCMDFEQIMKDIGLIKTWYYWYCWGCVGWPYTHCITFVICCVHLSKS